MRIASCPRPIPFLTLLVLVASVLQLTRATSITQSKWRLPRTFHPRRHSAWHARAAATKILDLRGGSSTTTATPATDDDDDATTTNSTSTKHKDEEEARSLRAYRWQQHLYMQSRGMLLRQALIARGLDEFHHSPEALEQAKRNVPVDWDCALATREHPKSCLYSFDAEPGTKVVAPLDTTQWISLSALNRLRRSDATKVEPLWHSQYSILDTWLNPEHTYSMYPYLTPVAAVLSFLLDSPAVLMGGMALAVVTAFLVTLPFWESLLTTVLTSSLLWLQWPNWGRFIHAALPLKLLLGQMAWKFIAMLASKVYGSLRQRLVEWECQLWEECMPLTILEGKMKEEAEAAAAAAAASEEEEDSVEEYFDFNETEDDDIDEVDSSLEEDEDMEEEEEESDDEYDFEDTGFFSEED